MRLTEKVISLFAPHTCLQCGTEGDLLCHWCRYEAFKPVPSRCYRCRRATEDYRVCVACRGRTRLKHVWVSTEYAATAKELVHVLKFGRAKAAAEVLAEAISDTLPYLPAETIITFVPSAPSRMRLRGYDHAKLIATTLAKQKNLPCLALLSRQTQVRQVGSTRAARFKQIKGAFRELNPSLIQDSTILLIDDVLTTGATIEEAGQVLKRAGAKQVNAAVFAHKL